MEIWSLPQFPFWSLHLFQNIHLSSNFIFTCVSTKTFPKTSYVVLRKVVSAFPWFPWFPPQAVVRCNEAEALLRHILLQSPQLQSRHPKISHAHDASPLSSHPRHLFEPQLVPKEESKMKREEKCGKGGKSYPSGWKDKWGGLELQLLTSPYTNWKGILVRNHHARVKSRTGLGGLQYIYRHLSTAKQHDVFVHPQHQPSTRCLSYFRDCYVPCFLLALADPGKQHWQDR